MPDKIILTIAISTYNRAHIVKEILLALLNQTVSVENFFVLVVNNASSDNTEHTIEEIKHFFKNFIYTIENNSGSSNARNKALQECTTPWIVYIDDDSKPEPQFIEALLQTVKQQSCDGIAGNIIPWRKYPLPHWFIDEYECFSQEKIKENRWLAPDEYAYGNNMAFRCDLLREIGGFSPDFGVRGKIVPFGEETELQARLKAHGGKILYAHNATIAHCAAPAKYTISAQLKIRYLAGKSMQVIFSRRRYVDLGWLLAKVPYRIIIATGKSIRRLWKKTYFWQNACVAVLGELAYFAGAFAGWWWLRQHQDWKPTIPQRNFS